MTILKELFSVLNEKKVEDEQYFVTCGTGKKFDLHTEKAFKSAEAAQKYIDREMKMCDDTDDGDAGREELENCEIMSGKELKKKYPKLFEAVRAGYQSTVGAERETDDPWADEKKDGDDKKVIVRPKTQHQRDRLASTIRSARTNARDVNNRHKAATSGSKSARDDAEIYTGNKTSAVSDKNVHWSGSADRNAGRGVHEAKDDDCVSRQCHAQAAAKSKADGVVQHINKDKRTGKLYVSDFYDDDETVATYNKGKLSESADLAKQLVRGEKSPKGLMAKLDHWLGKMMVTKDANRFLPAPSAVKALESYGFSGDQVHKIREAAAEAAQTAIARMQKKHGDAVPDKYLSKMGSSFAVFDLYLNVSEKIHEEFAALMRQLFDAKIDKMKDELAIVKEAQDSKGREIKAGDRLLWVDGNGEHTGTVSADPKFNGGLKVGGRSVKNIIDDADKVTVLKEARSIPSWFQDGAKVKLMPEYADKDPNEVFTLKSVDTETGKGRIADDQGKGWGISYYQVYPKNKTPAIHESADEKLTAEKAEKEGNVWLVKFTHCPGKTDTRDYSIRSVKAITSAQAVATAKAKLPADVRDCAKVADVKMTDEKVEEGFDGGKRTFKRAELEFELGHEDRAAGNRTFSYSKPRDELRSFGIEINGRLFKREGEPVHFTSKATADKAASTIASKDFNKGKTVKVVPLDEQANTSDESKEGRYGVKVGQVYVPADGSKNELKVLSINHKTEDALVFDKVQNKERHIDLFKLAKVRYSLKEDAALQGLGKSLSGKAPVAPSDEVDAPMGDDASTNDVAPPSDTEVTGDADDQQTSAEFKVGDIVKTLVGPHKGEQHDVVKVHADGRIDLKPKDIEGTAVKYRNGGITAKPDQVVLAESIIRGTKSLLRTITIDITEGKNDNMMPLSYKPAKGHKIEAYGRKGMKNTMWRKYFKDSDAMAKWCEDNDATVEGSRDLEKDELR